MTPWIFVPMLVAAFFWCAVFDGIKSARVRRDHFGSWIFCWMAAVVFSSWTLDIAGVRL